MQQGIGQAGCRLLFARNLGEAVVLQRKRTVPSLSSTWTLENAPSLRLDALSARSRPSTESCFLTQIRRPRWTRLRPWALMRKPFYLPELLNMLNNNPSNRNPPEPATTRLPFVK
jgi:hypothetical protein